MRSRERILDNLEDLYRRRLDDAESDGDRRTLDFQFQRDQLVLEVLLDLRTLLRTEDAQEGDSESLLDKAEKLKKLRALTRLR